MGALHEDQKRTETVDRYSAGRDNTLEEKELDWAKDLHQTHSADRSETLQQTNRSLREYSGSSLGSVDPSIKHESNKWVFNPGGIQSALANLRGGKGGSSSGDSYTTAVQLPRPS